ncbi:GAF domain-containing protein [Streptomyces xanthophaeus]
MLHGARPPKIGVPRQRPQAQVAAALCPSCSAQDRWRARLDSVRPPRYPRPVGPARLVWLEPAGEAAGALPECWPAETQPSPDVLECCQRVAESGRPQFRARAESGASAFAFAGVPLIGGSGEVLGVLAVMDPSPRVWSEDDVQDLSDLAAACSAQMRMRKRSENGRQAREDAEDAEDAAYAAEGETHRTRKLLNRSELLLRASEDLADTSGLDDVRQRVGDLVSGDLKPARIDLVLLRQGRLHHVRSHVDGEWPEVPEAFDLGSSWPVAQAVRENRIVVASAPPETDAPDVGLGSPAFANQGLASAACLPLRGTHRVLGALVLGGTPRTGSAPMSARC